MLRKVLAVSSTLALLLLLLTTVEDGAFGFPQEGKAPQKKPAGAAPSAGKPDHVEDIDAAGEPKLEKSDKGIRHRLWSDAKGWHLEVHSTTTRVYKGRIRVIGGRILEADGAGSGENHPGKAGKGKKGPAKSHNVDEGHWTPKEITYRFETGKGKDIVHFQVSPEAESLEFHCLVDDEDMPLDRIFIGQSGKHPTQKTFYLKTKPNR